MKIINLKCKVITPMFMSGTDRNTAELRASEFKGMMRFWWRAIKSEKNIDALRRDEAIIFGGTGENEGKSKVRIRVYPDKVTFGEYKPIYDKGFTFKCINVESTFYVEIKSDYDIEVFKNIFFLSTLLGGFGRRQRRGFGSVYVEDFKILSVDESLEEIKNLLNKIANSKQFHLKDKKIINSKHGSNYPWIRECMIGSPKESWEEIIRKIKNSSHNHRDPALGNASPRMASPIFVSIIKVKEGFAPIITVLNNSFPSPYPRYNLSKQQNFIKEILT